MSEPFRDIIYLPLGKPSIPQIIAHVAARRGLTVADLKGRSRTRKIAQARQEAMWELRQRTSLSFPQIADRLNLKDHTTVMHGVDRHQGRLQAQQGAA